MRPPKKVVAYSEEGIRVFDNVKDAAAHYVLPIHVVYTLIKNGKEIPGGVTFDYQRWDD